MALVEAGEFGHVVAGLQVAVLGDGLLPGAGGQPGDGLFVEVGDHPADQVAPVRRAVFSPSRWRQQDRAGVTDQPFSVGGDRQPAVPPDTLTHRKGAPASAANMASTPESLQFRGTFFMF
ncbi:hypothetical protein [Nonomuraea sp. NPDC050786]|uniref:hypothetical protein n=1 Tax=Nonomuraea sp. NPDC050786 TaxID=3154840 RepID=UPI0033CBF48C